MLRVSQLPFAVGALLIVGACQSDSPTTPAPIRPLASFSDGAHNGNPDFFFLPPIFKNPNANPNFEPAAFNPDVRPTVEICELGLALPPSTVRVCVAGDPLRRFSASEIQLSTNDQQYKVNWDTKQSDLVLTKEYRIRVLLGSKELGYVDIDPVLTGSQLKNVQTGELIGLVDDRTLPIKFRIENAAACDGADPCNSKTIDLSQDNSIVLSTGDRVDIPAQSSNQVVTLTVDLCDGLNIDLPVFGNCLRVRSDPPLAAPLSPRATVSMCSLRSITIPLPHPQQDLLTLHRQDDAVITALPHSGDYCSSSIGGVAPPRSLFADVWRLVGRAAASLLPQPLHATTLVLDVGQGGETDGFSDFQFALPAKMTIASLVEQVADPNAAVASVPSVAVTDADGNPVVGVTVHFLVGSGGGSVTPAGGAVLTDATGHATLTEWLIGAAGRYTLRASGRGIADPSNNGPAEGFDPFAPAVLHDRDQDVAQSPVAVGTGALDFTAAAQAITPPTTPLNVTALRGDGQVTVNWEAPANDGGAPVESYTVTASPGGATASALHAPAVISGLTNGTSYTFTVVATNSAGSGPASLPSNAVTPAGLPGAPSGLSFSAGAAGGTLSWDNAFQNGSAITGYVVEVRRGGPSGPLVQNLSVTGTRSSVSGIPMCDYAAPGSVACIDQYALSVAAVNDVGVGPRSGPFAAVTKVSFTADGLPALFERQGCTGCHNPLGSPPNLVGSLPVVYPIVSALLGGAIYEKPSGTSLLPHAGGTLFTRDSFEYDVLSRWVRDGKFF